MLPNLGVGYMTRLKWRQFPRESTKGIWENRPGDVLSGRPAGAAWKEKELGVLMQTAHVCR